MIVSRLESKESIFERLDPRTRILWMFILSALVIIQTSLLPIILLILFMIPVWVIAKRVGSMFISTLKLVPFLGFLFVIQLIVVWVTKQEFLSQKAIYLACVEVIRFYVMLASSILLFQTTDFGEITNSIRSLKIARSPVWNRVVESFAFVIGTAYQTVPLLKREMEIMVQVQRARGMGVTEGGKIEQVVKLVRMGSPLFVRSLELTKNSALALINYGYSPLRQRSQYRSLEFVPLDWLVFFFLALQVSILFLLF